MVDRAIVLFVVFGSAAVFYLERSEKDDKIGNLIRKLG
jgi:hypothetical protein